MDDVTANTPNGGEPTEGGPPAPYFATVGEFVDDWLLPTYRRSVRGPDRTWCPRWWQHPEALSRLDALWRAWEALRLDPSTGLSVWWRDHCDHHMNILLDSNGPFKGCEDGHADRPLEPLPSEAAPSGLFDRDVDDLPHAGEQHATAVPARLSAPDGARSPTPRNGNRRGF